MPDLFAASTSDLPAGLRFKAGLFDRQTQAALLAAVGQIAADAPFRRPQTKGQGRFSAAITNCGTVGWWSDHKGYRYTPTQPESDAPWPAMPELFRIAVAAAVADTAWSRFSPDACLINFYQPTAKMGLHQDRDERDFNQPIVTISLGDSADFLIGGQVRSDKPQVLRVAGGDALIMGPPSRMLFHGVRRIIAGGAGRTSLTFRKAL